MANLVIVESPSKASTIKGYLGSNYKVIASKGHVRDLPKSSLGIDVDDGFKPHYINIRGKGDVIADLNEDLAAEQKARVTYDNLLRLINDPDVKEPIKFLRQREVNHFQRFGEAMELLRQKLNQKNVYYMNPAFDM